MQRARELQTPHPHPPDSATQVEPPGGHPCQGTCESPSSFISLQPRPSPQPPGGRRGRGGGAGGPRRPQGREQAQETCRTPSGRDSPGTAGPRPPTRAAAPCNATLGSPGRPTTKSGGRPSAARSSAALSRGTREHSRRSGETRPPRKSCEPTREAGGRLPLAALHLWPPPPPPHLTRR